MLVKLTIKNVALIDCVEINFSEGLNVLSGETGAGKSIILESLNFVLGAKAEKSLIRTGTTECYVQVVFDVSKISDIKHLFDHFDIEYEDLLIISRKFTIDGKNSIKINGISATVGMLKNFTSMLVDVHGQSEHFYLMKTSNQLNMIDKFGGKELSLLKCQLKDLHLKYIETVKKLNELVSDEQQRLVKLDVLKYQVNEIESCDLKEAEEENLLNLREKNLYQERILTALNTLKSSISNENCASDILRNAVRAIDSISQIGDEYLELSERINNVFSELNDISDTASSLLDSFDDGDYNIDYIEERLEKIKVIKKKYGNSYNEIYTFLVDAKNEIDRLNNFNELSTDLISERNKFEETLYDLYTKLSALRKQSAKTFTQNVVSEIRELGMINAEFYVKFNELVNKEQCEFNSGNGIDNIEFLFSANKGEPLKPLSAVISGGEISRFMLSIKAQTAKFNDISTFIFDEIDAGISGVTAKIVAEKFAKLSKHVQIIAISHLPQISAMADNNLLITKTENDGITKTNVKTLSKEEKVLEIIRLIGGESDSETALLHAKNLISQANEYKELSWNKESKYNLNLKN